MGSLGIKITYLILILWCLAFGIYIIYDIFYPKKENSWEVLFENDISDEQRSEISGAVLFFVKLHPEQITPNNLAEMLKLNPRVKSVQSIEISAHKQIRLEITLKKTTAIFHLPEKRKFQEISSDMHILQENIQNNAHFGKKIPIFYLTERIENRRETRVLTGDIMKIYLETKNSLSFVWERMSEISLDESGQNYIFYASGMRSRISSGQKFNKAFLLRLWGLFFYLEKNFKNKWTDVKLNMRNAQIHFLNSIICLKMTTR